MSAKEEEMVEIIAVVRMNKMNETKQVLSEIGLPAFSACKVMGRGKGKVDHLILKGAEAGYDEAISQLGPSPKMYPKRLLIIVVAAKLKSKVIRAIIRVNQTGEPGDGKIFVLPVTNVCRVRTGETDLVALS
jgi:nitrogen regulatory protein PII 2